MGRVIVITGVMAAGKSTVASLLAEQLPRSVHIRGDAFRRMIINGRRDMTPTANSDARKQLHLRYELAAHTAARFAGLGFDAIVQDVILGQDLERFMAQVTWPRRYLVVLSPNVSAIEIREKEREKQGYTDQTPTALDAVLRDSTPKLGYWLDSSAQTPAETVTDILTNLDRAALKTPNAIP